MADKFRIEFRSLPFELTPLEVAGKAREMAKECTAADKAEQERVAKVGEATDLRKTVKGHNAKVIEIAKLVTAGKEYRSTKCEWRPHPTAERMQLVRLDVPDDAPDKVRIIDARPMTPAEKKGHYSGEVAPSSASPAPDSPTAASAGAEKKKGAKKPPKPCPAILSEHKEDPLLDKVCGKDCDKGKIACDEHIEEAGNNTTKVHWRFREMQREEAAKKAAGCQVPMYPGVNDVVCGEPLPCTQHADKGEHAGEALQ